MIQCAFSRRRTLDERGSGRHDGLEKDLPARVGLGDCDYETADPVEDTTGQIGLGPSVRSTVVRLVGISGSRLVRLSKAAKRQSVGFASPSGIRAPEDASRLRRSESLIVTLDAEVAGLQQAPEVTYREIRLDPVAPSKQRTTRPCLRGGEARRKRHRPVVSQRLFPYEGSVLVGRADDFHLVERGARC